MESIPSILLILVTEVESESDVDFLLVAINFILSSISFLFADMVHLVESSAVGWDVVT